jgi:hypothetical protein
MHPKPQSLKQPAADPQALAVKVLAWLANDPDLLSRFLALSGLSAGELRRAAGDPGFDAGLLDFVMAHEPTLIAFCEANDLKPETVAAAWARISGPGLASGDY